MTSFSPAFLGRVVIEKSYLRALIAVSELSTWELLALGTTTPGFGTAYSGSSLWFGSASDRYRIVCASLSKLILTVSPQPAFLYALVVSTPFFATAGSASRPRQAQVSRA